MAQGQTQALALHAHGDEPDAGPGIEPAVQELQLGRAWRELEEAEGGEEVRQSASTGHVPGRMCQS